MANPTLYRGRAALTVQCPLDQRPGWGPAGSGSWVLGGLSGLFILSGCLLQNVPSRYMAGRGSSSCSPSSFPPPSLWVSSRSPTVSHVEGEGQQETSADLSFLEDSWSVMPGPQHCLWALRDLKWDEWFFLGGLCFGPGEKTEKSAAFPSWQQDNGSNPRLGTIYCSLVIWPAFTGHLALVVKNPPASAGDIRDMGSASGWGWSPGEGHGNPLQYSCLENPMDRGAW